MKELTIEHLAAYLPYDVEIVGNTHGEVATLSAVSDTGVNIKGRGLAYGMWADHFDIKLSLRPLSQLTETIENNGERFRPIDRLCTKFGNGFDYTMMQGEYDSPEFPYMVVTYLHSIHFDTFGLIEADLAIAVPSIPQP